MKRILLLLLLISSMAQAQTWKRYRKEISVGIGATNFLGDLGGANQIGTHVFRDIEFSTTRPDISAGFRYFFTQSISAKAGIYYGLVSGSDNLTGQPQRNYRNLSFKSNIWELSAQAEVSGLTVYREGHRYDIKRAHGYKNILFQAYGFFGVGVFHFNPKGYYRGRWYNLRDMGTEGQGLPGEPDKYKRFSFCMPIGAGFRYGISKNINIGIEYGIRKTFTDYIDDVSGVYYDKETIRANSGDAAAYFSDPSSGLDPNATTAGEDRGHPNYKDTYMFMFVTLNYRIADYHKRTNAKF
ncbi:MAG: outer membrane beta-barrel protein [Bacteroidetes bacterium]|nr:outer membrane beta-barrel protein [Bacteroidota bacterium]